ncbi:DUF4328 domain-containing protein [Mycobacterium sp.]|uniref:DUF4328 domain-containing protein n=1 Tax=Mycobacterium sp. TaxID=1785 RepID=UPI003BAD3E84
MIQVCSQCGTRWNVRERQRARCPRCRGALMAPLVDPPVPDGRWRTPAGPPVPPTRGLRPAPPQLPPGFRWIAVRPGAAPRLRSVRRSRGPTPRYTVMPRWGLADRVEQPVAPPVAKPAKAGPSAAAVRTSLLVSLLVLCVAALVFVGRYLLLIINRNTLLNSVVAGVSVGLGVVASLVAIVAVSTTFVLLIRWLAARRAAAFTQQGLPEQRSVRALWIGCLLPLVNLLWAPVYVIELALVEDQYVRMRRPILVWWSVWVASSMVSVFALATSWASDAQGIANNTVAMVLAYLCAAAAVAALARVYEGFEGKPVERPAHRWVVVSADRSDDPARRESGDVVELAGQEPAA